jgi:hypothetical protein
MRSAMSYRKELMQVLVIAALGLIAVRGWAQAGPPFQTDDPNPVDLGHYEAYVFWTFDGTGAELDPVGPAFEFNWGAAPNIQLHAILPFGAALPTNNPAYLPGGDGVERLWAERYGIRGQVGIHPPDQAPATDWVVHDVRDSDGQL